MSGGTVLQIFLYIQVFAIGALTAAGIYYARAHFRQKSHPHDHEPLPPEQLPIRPAGPMELPDQSKAQMLHLSEEQFKSALNQTTAKLQEDLGVTAGHINNLVMRLASEIVSGELERYRQDLSKLHEQANANMGGVSAEVAKHEEEVKAKITQELEAEKQHMLKQIDTKLADAVGSFLSEALTHNIDLGTQSAYLVQLLEEHKAEFANEVKNDAAA
jgi:hypothetical protein